MKRHVYLGICLGIGTLCITLTACSGDDETNASDQLSQASSACADGELDALNACFVAHCSDRDDALTCVQTFCVDEFLSVTGTCQTCLLDHATLPIDEIAAACEPEPDPRACFAGELDPLASCLDLHCRDTDDVAGCAQTLCLPELLGLSGECQGCLLDHADEPVDDVLAICGPQAPPPPPPACVAGELDDLELCVAARCADTDDLLLCAQSFCIDAFLGVSGTCQSCLLSHPGQTADDIEAACAPPPACDVGEMDPLSACVNEHCADDEDLFLCAQTFCVAEFLDLSGACQTCVLTHPDKSAEEVEIVCAL